MNPQISIVIPTHNRPQELKRLLKSLKSSSYPLNKLQIIVVNNGTKLDKTFMADTIIQNESNKGLANARNQGAYIANGKYILFIDDDNVVDQNMLENLVNAMESNSDLTASGPVTYYLNNKKKIWFVGAKINLWTTKPAFLRSIGQGDKAFQNQIRVDNLHNCLLVARKNGEEVGWFDEKIFMNGTEFDLIQRIKKNNPTLYCATITTAECYHDVPEYDQDLIRSLGFENPKRAYYFQRNRGVFQKRYASLLQQFCVFLVFYPLFFISYSLLFVVKGRTDLLWQHIKGTCAGYYYMFRPL